MAFDKWGWCLNWLICCVLCTGKVENWSHSDIFPLILMDFFLPQITFSLSRFNFLQWTELSLALTKQRKSSLRPSIIQTGWNPIWMSLLNQLRFNNDTFLAKNLTSAFFSLLSAQRISDLPFPSIVLTFGSRKSPQFESSLSKQPSEIRKFPNWQFFYSTHYIKFPASFPAKPILNATSLEDFFQMEKF